MHGRVVHLVHFYGHHFLQLLDLLLHLHSLGGLIAEALYELAHVGHLFLLVFVGPLLLFTAFLPQHHILVVLDLVVYDSAARDFQGTVRHVIDECPVVTDQHHSTRRLGEKLLQPLYGLDVQMVGRLVQQQDVGLLQQNLGQLYTHAPAPRELTGRTVKVRTAEAQADQRALQLSLTAFGTHQLVALMLLGKALHKSHVVLTLVVSTLTQLTVQRVYTLLHLRHVGKSLLCFLSYGGVILQHHHLWQIAYGGVMGHADGAACGLLLPTEYFQQGGFSCAVLAHQGYTVPVVHHETRVGEQRLHAKFHMQ